VDARLLIRADDVVPTAQRFTLPGSSVWVQNTPSFFGELRVAWKDPVLMPPGSDRFVVQDSPDGAGADRWAQGHRSSVSQLRSRQPTQWQLGLADGLTSDCLDDCAVARGKCKLASAARLISQAEVAACPDVPDKEPYENSAGKTPDNGSAPSHTPTRGVSWLAGAWTDYVSDPQPR
jgi:hypothetical protein